MDDSERGRSFRFTWKLKHVSYLWHREHQFLKWTFNIKRNVTTSWSLLFYPSTPKNCVSCILRKERGEPLNSLVDYELSFLHQNGCVIHSLKVSNADFNCNNKSIQLWLHHDDVLNNKGISLPEDTLSICCKIWTTNLPILDMVGYFAETEIKVQQRTIIWEIAAVTGLQPGMIRRKFVNNPATSDPCICFNFFIDVFGNYMFEIVMLPPKLIELCKCQVFLLETSGIKRKCGRFEVVTIGKMIDPDWKFHLSLTKRNLMENKALYILNDTLTLKCEIGFATGIEVEPVQKLEPNCQNSQNASYKEIGNISTSFINVSESPTAPKNDSLPSNKLDLLETKVISLHPKNNDLSSTLIAAVNCNSENLKGKEPESLSYSSKQDLQSLDNSSAGSYNHSSLSWQDDLLALRINATLCDAELHVASDYFPVHSLILSIRSAVFCDMFKRAKIQDKKTSISIKDLDTDTVEKMILFLYTDTLCNLECECAIRLYIASIKYEIPPLKYICSSFLKQNMSTIHCCKTLFLADGYNDDDLKEAIQDFIAEHEEVLHSEQWISMEERHPRLSIETFRYIHMRYRKNEISLK